ncbi:hypothetical protein [Lysinibacillus sp. NPDC047702]|uniref:hypothetical protein n=1 Tax=unclassified Lysinibacillus TaxID=2636778 RepID=UPI003D065AA4
MHIACSINKSYIQHCSAMILSVLQSTIAEEIHIHVLHKELNHNDETLMQNLFTNKYNVK